MSLTIYILISDDDTTDDMITDICVHIAQCLVIPLGCYAIYTLSFVSLMTFTVLKIALGGGIGYLVTQTKSKDLIYTVTSYLTCSLAFLTAVNALLLAFSSPDEKFRVRSRRIDVSENGKIEYMERKTRKTRKSKKHKHLSPVEASY